MNATEQKEKIAGMSERQFRDFVVDEFRNGAEQFTSLHEALEENTKLTKQNIEATAGLVATFKGARVGAAAFIWFGRTLRKLWKIFYPIALFFGAVWALANGKWPKIPGV